MNDYLLLIPSTAAPAGFPFLENHVRARLGIAKDEQRALRQKHLTEGQDWRLQKKRVWLSLAAVKALARVKALPVPVLGPDAQTDNAVDGEAVLPLVGNAEKNAGLKGAPTTPAVVAYTAPEPITLQFVRATRNPHIIECCGAEDDWLRPKKPLVRVRVRSGVNFQRGMKLPAILVAGYQDLYDLGRACPKKPGRW